MLNKDSVAEIDHLFRMATGSGQRASEHPFGGKLVIFSGDFKQTLPVVKQGDLDAAVTAALFSSSLWGSLQKRALYTNHRFTGENVQYLQFVQDVGCPSFASDSGFISVPQLNIFVSTRRDLINFCFPDLTDPEALDGCAILCSRNSDVLSYNTEITTLFPGDGVVSTSIDQSIGEQDEFSPTTEFLNRQTPSGFPHHELLLKTGMRVMLIRNLNVGQGLANGTLLRVETARNMFVRAVVLTGPAKGNIVGIPPISFVCDATESQFAFKRLQLPLVPAFAFTIHKAQGQTLNRVGLDLTNPVFTHGQLYVAISRIHNASDMRIIGTPESSSAENEGIRNRLWNVASKVALRAIAPR